MDIASSAWLNSNMRFGFLAWCGLLAIPLGLVGQSTTAPVILVQPVSVTAYVGDSATLTVTVDGAAPISYQWHRNTVSIPGATTASYSVASVTLNDLAGYHVVATNSFGSAQSLPVAISVSKRPQSITLSPIVATATAGSSLLLTATSTSNLPVSLSLVSGAAVLTGNTLRGSGGNVTIRASQAGNETYAPAEPVEWTYNFVVGAVSPFITSPPSDQTVTVGSAATFRATAIGTPAPTLQWQKDGVDLFGATTSTLTLATTTTADSGRYTIVATNTSGTSSASATLVVRAPPDITTPPVSQSVFAGDRVSLTVAATGVPAPTFQWRKNGVAIAGATSSTLTFASVAATDAGRFEVVVTNALGSVTSAAATITVATRDFAGTYFGRFNGTSGEFALLVRADRSAVFIAHLPALQTGVAVADLRLDLTGAFTVNTITLASATEVVALESRPEVAAAPQPVTLRGNIDESIGAVTGTISGLSTTFEGARTERTGSASTIAGLYRTAIIGSATDRGYVLIAPNAQTFFITSSGTTIDSARGDVDRTGLLTASTVAQGTVNFTVNNGALNGTLRFGASNVATLAGAAENRIGSEHLANLSVRTVTAAGVSNLISGFVVTGTAPKQVLIRVAGPALATPPFNIGNAVGNPTLQLFRGNTAIGQNDDWGTPAANVAALTAAATRAGAFPFRAGSQDAALLTTLTPGAYSVVIGGGNGTALAEVYEVLENNEVVGARRLVNVSARGVVSPAAPFIAGFVISGTGPQRVLIRGIGPTLATPPFGVGGALPNPQLALFRGTVAVKTNDDWFRDPDATAIRDAAARAGAFALGGSSLDAAILVQLEPGAYTAQISAPANNPNATGIALIEIYDAAP
jgi:hypothetical protein